METPVYASGLRWEVMFTNSNLLLLPDEQTCSDPTAMAKFLYQPRLHICSSTMLGVAVCTVSETDDIPTWRMLTRHRPSLSIVSYAIMSRYNCDACTILVLIRTSSYRRPLTFRNGLHQLIMAKSPVCAGECG